MKFVAKSRLGAGWRIAFGNGQLTRRARRAHGTAPPTIDRSFHFDLRCFTSATAPNRRTTIASIPTSHPPHIMAPHAMLAQMATSCTFGPRTFSGNEAIGRAFPGDIRSLHRIRAAAHASTSPWRR